MSSQEQFRELLIRDLVAVVVTNRRVLAFSALTGGFFTEDRSSDEQIIASNVNANVVILSTPARYLIFRSQLAIWADLR